MTTTTVRLPEELKNRVAKLAEAAGLSTHNFIVQAVAERAEAEEARAEFDKLAERRWAHFKRTGLSVPFDEMMQFVRKRAAGKAVLPPKGRRFEPRKP
jgi:predicted transcriptional regulator